MITREGCKQDLKRWAKANFLHDAVLFSVMVLIFVPLMFLSIYIAKRILVLGVVFALACAVAPVIFIYRIVLDIITVRLVERDSFSIVRDTVCRLSKGEIPQKYSEGGDTVDVIYFKKYGRYVASGITFDISSVGDECYLVIVHGKKEKLVFAFHSTMYECKDLDMPSV